MKKILKIILILTLVSLLLFSATGSFALQITKKSNSIHTENNFLTKNIIETSEEVEDYDPLVDIKITFTIKEIRAYEKIDLFNEPDFYVKVFINDKEYTSLVWKNMKYVKNPDCSWTVDVPDNEKFVNIEIQLWDKNFGKDRLCDISGSYDLFSDAKTADLIYNIKTGHWFGDDKVNHYPEWDDRGDSSGYGRLSGCDDGSIYQRDLDCLIQFDITQNDYDKDGITYWMEKNVYNTDPTVSDIGKDYDDDGVPIEWEYKWGHSAYYHERDDKWYESFKYDPFTWENHSSFDPDEDGVDNIEEYKTEKIGFRTQPNRKDILLELDQMDFGPNGEGGIITEYSKDLLRDAFGKHNIVFHIDDQGQQIPFDKNTSYLELQEIYFDHFMNGNKSYWRRGVFHYAPIIYKSDRVSGFMWSSIIGVENWSEPWNFSKYPNASKYGDCFQISTFGFETLPYEKPIRFTIAHRTFNKTKQKATIYAAAMMHETGHVLGIFHDNSNGCDNRNIRPWQEGFWIFFRYWSCMNYAWTYAFVDYSDGSNGKYDKDDWSNIDLTLFQKERNPLNPDYEE